MSSDSAQSGPDSPRARSGAFAAMAVWLLRLQALLGVAAATVAVFAVHVSWALALLAGSGIGIVLTAVSALRSALLPERAGAATMAAAFYRGMMLKMALAVVMFVIVAALFAEWFVPVLIGYGVTLVAYWVALLRIGRAPDPSGALDEE